MPEWLEKILTQVPALTVLAWVVHRFLDHLSSERTEERKDRQEHRAEITSVANAAHAQAAEGKRELVEALKELKGRLT